MSGRHRRVVSIALALVAVAAWAQAQEPVRPDEMLLDATWVPCNDTTESLFIFRDGRAIFARHDQGIIFTIGGGLLADLSGVVARSKSFTDTGLLDSCTTLGVIADGPLFLLINSRRPSVQVKEMHERLEQLRRYARRKLDRMDQLAERASALPDTSIESHPTLESQKLAGLIYASPVAAEWRCRGTVLVTALVGVDGRVRRAFVDDARVHGKCASLLTMTALRAVLLAPFQPAQKSDGKETVAWKKVEVVFGGGTASSAGRTVAPGGTAPAGGTANPSGTPPAGGTAIPSGTPPAGATANPSGSPPPGGTPPPSPLPAGGEGERRK